MSFACENPCGLGCGRNSHRSQHQPQKYQNLLTMNFMALGVSRWMTQGCHISNRNMNNKCSMLCDKGLLGAGSIGKL